MQCGQAAAGLTWAASKLASVTCVLLQTGDLSMAGMADRLCTQARAWPCTPADHIHIIFTSYSHTI